MEVHSSVWPPPSPRNVPAEISPQLFIFDATVSVPSSLDPPQPTKLMMRPQVNEVTILATSDLFLFCDARINIVAYFIQTGWIQQGPGEIRLAEELSFIARGTSATTRPTGSAPLPSVHLAVAPFLPRGPIPLRSVSHGRQRRDGRRRWRCDRRWRRN